MCYKSLESLKISCIDGLGPSPVVDQLCAVIGTIKELMALHLEGVRREHADFEPYCFMTHSHLHLVPRERERVQQVPILVNSISSRIDQHGIAQKR